MNNLHKDRETGEVEFIPMGFSCDGCREFSLPSESTQVQDAIFCHKCMTKFGAVLDESTNKWRVNDTFREKMMYSFDITL